MSEAIVIRESTWHAGFHALIRSLYYSRVTVHGREHLPSHGPVLLLLLHRNGGVDGFVYRAVWPQICYTLKATLRKSLMGRIFFNGLEIARSDDGADASENLAVIEQCVTVLKQGACLGIFPEGTSKLGPAHLSFRSGAARIASQYRSQRDDLCVVPCGIHYERAWAFRSRVEIVIGSPISLDATASLGSIRKEFTIALEQVGANFPDAATQQIAERFAYMATLGTSHSYATVLQQLARGIPAELHQGWDAWEKTSCGRSLFLHQGVPLFPLRHAWLYVLAGALMFLFILPGVIVQALPLSVAAIAGKTLSDDTNVIALWRILTGMPIALLWNLLLLILLAWNGSWLLLCGAWCSSALTIFLWYRCKKTLVVAANGLFHRDLREAAQKLHALVLHSLTS